jgi:hypothetical protein
LKTVPKRGFKPSLVTGKSRNGRSKSLITELSAKEVNYSNYLKGGNTESKITTPSMEYKMKLFSLSAVIFLTVSIGYGQVPVSQEPRHHKVLDNGHVRLLNVTIPPGDTTQFHIHATPSVFVVLADAKTGSQVLSEEDRSSSPIVHYGNIWFEGFYVKPRIHRVYNSDDHLFNVMDIELTNKNLIIIDSSLSQEGFTFLFEEKPVRAYRMHISSGRIVSVRARKADILIIQLNDSLTNTGSQIFIPNNQRAHSRTFNKLGYYLYISAGTAFEIKNEGSGEGDFAFFELK